MRSQACVGLSGGDTDLAVDGADNVYQTDLWLGNSCMSVSSSSWFRLSATHEVDDICDFTLKWRPRSDDKTLFSLFDGQIVIRAGDGRRASA